MTQKELFGVILRSAGLFIVMTGVYQLLSSGWVWLTPGRPHAMSMPQYLAYGILLVLPGLYMLRGAPLLMRFCFPAIGVGAWSADETPE